MDTISKFVSITKTVAAANLMSLEPNQNQDIHNPYRTCNWRNGNLHKTGDEKSMGEDMAGISTTSSDSTVENTMDEMHEQAPVSKRASKITLLRPTMKAEITTDDLDVPFTVSNACSSPPIRTSRVPSDDLIVSHTQSWVTALFQRNGQKSIKEDALTPTALCVNSSSHSNCPCLAPVSICPSLETVMQGKKSYSLPKAQPVFKDATGYYYNVFKFKLQSLNSKSSEGPLCIENYLIHSENEWLNRLWDVKTGKLFGPKRTSFNLSSTNNYPSSSSLVSFGYPGSNHHDEFLIAEDYKPLPFMKKLFLQRVFGHWPVYSFFIAFVSISYPSP